MIDLLSETVQVARKIHICGECEREIVPGVPYTRQVCTDGGHVWSFKAHTDCLALGTAYRDKHNAWRGYGDWLSMLETIEPHEFNEWRGFYPHAVCRLELYYSTQD